MFIALHFDVMAMAREQLANRQQVVGYLHLLFKLLARDDGTCVCNLYDRAFGRGFMPWHHAFPDNLLIHMVFLPNLRSMKLMGVLEIQENSSRSAPSPVTRVKMKGES